MTTDGAIQLDSLKAQFAILEFCRTKKAEIAELEEQARATIEAALGDNEIGLIEGRPAVRWTRSTRRALDSKALKAAEPDIFDAYCKVTEVRRFTLVGGEE